MADEKYIAIHDWDDHQAAKGDMHWIKVRCHLEDSDKISGLSLYQQGLLIGLWRLRGRTGKNILNDVTRIARALHINATDRPHIRHAIGTLTARKLLVLTNQQVGFTESHREEERREEKKVQSQPQQAPPTPIRPEPVFTAMDAAKVLCDFEHLNLSGNHNLELAREVLTKAMLAWQVDALTAVDRVAENWRAYLTAKEPQKKQQAKWWLSDGSWNTVIVSARPTRPLHMHERQKLKDMGVDMNLPTEKLFAILREEKPRVN